MSFLPDNYEPPKDKSNYMKFDEGENKFRVLSHAIVGWEYWIQDGKARKPIRVKTWDELPPEQQSPASQETTDAPKFFWAFVVLNRQTNDIQILEIGQRGIQKQIEKFVKNKAWGDPKKYDIIVNKERTGSDAKNVKYFVLTEPPTELETGVMDVYRAMNINLNALYEGKNPFQTEDVVLTKKQTDNIK